MNFKLSFYFTSVGLSVLSSAALAADLPVKAPAAVVAAAYNWTGVYAGVHAGWGGGSSDWSGIGYRGDGALAGGQVGANQQLGNFVLGVEAEASWAGIKGSQSEHIAIPFTVSDFNATVSSRIDSITTLSGRFGFAADRWLVFVKAGAAWVHERHSQSQVSTIQGVPGQQTVSIAGTNTRVGPLLGFGAEYAFLGNWSAKFEYDYIDLSLADWQREDGPLTSFSGVTSNVTTNVRIVERLHLIKLGLNYRYGPATSPAIAPMRSGPGFTWSGLYLGAQGAGAWSSTHWAGFSPFDGYHDKGWLAGVTGGVNAQAGALVAGVEAEWMGGLINGGRSDITSTTVNGTSAQWLATRIDWLSMVTGRVGFIAGDRWLVYGKGGIALVHATHTNNFAFAGAPGITSSFFLNRGDTLHTGTVIGVGTEYAFLGNWSLKFEYDYIRFRNQDVFLPGTITEISPVLGSGTTSLPSSASIRQDYLHLAKFGLNYHFAPDLLLVSR